MPWLHQRFSNSTAKCPKDVAHVHGERRPGPKARVVEAGQRASFLRDDCPFNVTSEAGRRMSDTSI